MAERIAGFPFWPVAFNERGEVVRQSAVDNLLRGIEAEAITDLFIFSHGWNNTAADARDLYQRFFAQVRAVLDARPAPAPQAITAGVVGIIWPSKRWDDEPTLTAHGGAAGLDDAPTDGDLVRGMKPVFRTARQKRALNDLARLLDERPDDPAALDRFQRLMGRLTDTPDATDAEEDNGEAAMIAAEPERVFGHFAASGASATRAGGAAGLGDAIASLWDGAKEALRAATYWEMKKRAGVVGQHGLGPLIGQVAAAQPPLRVHLLGHSFGARVVAFALAGLPDRSGATSPVKSVFLLQGAFSHFAFADALPFDPARGGALAGTAARVDGPLLVSHSRFDDAVGKAYPLASMLSRDDAAAADDLLFQWGAMGHDGAQAVSANEETLGPVGHPYQFVAGAFMNLDGNAIIVGEHPPPDGHGDIFHPEIAWAALAAAGVTT